MGPSIHEAVLGRAQEKSHADCMAVSTVSLSLVECDALRVMRFIALITTSLVAGNLTWVGSLIHRSRSLNEALIRVLPATGYG